MLNDAADIAFEPAQSTIGSRNGNGCSSGQQMAAIEDAVKRLLNASGAALDDPHLAETPKRVARTFADELLNGYRQNVSDLFKTFEEPSDEIVLVRRIPFYSLCAHHMLPFFGSASVVYKPKGRVLGLSKMNRLVDCYARRLQIQERLTRQVSDALQKYLEPRAAIVLLRAEHLCMSMRGVKSVGTETVTCATHAESETDLLQCQRLMRMFLQGSSGIPHERTSCGASEF